jgi:multicomponent Na+:H+ antiporter subunit D
MDWFYRKGGSFILWVAKNPLQWFDTAWGEAYRAVGLSSLMTTAKFWGWFDWHAIDGVIDGFARTVRGLGGRLRLLQAGQIQYTMYFAATFAAVILIAYVLLQLS